jgi:hypothetical protein
MNKGIRTTSPYGAYIKWMVERALAHPALVSPFFSLWKSGRLEPEQFKIFAANYDHWITSNITRLGLTYISVSDLLSRIAIISILNDELGNGNPNKAHVCLSQQWLDGLLPRVCGHPFDRGSTDLLLLPTTWSLYEESLELCGHPDVAVACGAFLAQEWHGYGHLVKLGEGFQNYKSLYQPEEWPHVSSYFGLARMKRKHREWSVHLALRACKTEEDVERLEYGFLHFLDLLADFWYKLYAAIR